MVINSRISISQNLVPNFSFEQSDSCPTNEDQIQYAIGWSKSSNVISTPDYFNACAPSSFFGVPLNGNGYQPDHRNCNAYAGVVTFSFSPVNYREQIGIQLNHPLVIGQKYFLSFLAVMSQATLGPDYAGMPSNNIGIRFSIYSYTENNPAPVSTTSLAGIHKSKKRFTLRRGVLL